MAKEDAAQQAALRALANREAHWDTLERARLELESLRMLLERVGRREKVKKQREALQAALRSQNMLWSVPQSWEVWAGHVSLRGSMSTQCCSFGALPSVIIGTESSWESPVLLAQLPGSPASAQPME